MRGTTTRVQSGSRTEPCLFVIIGATGDLARRKLFPALFQLMEDGLLSSRCRILGVARDDRMNDERFRALARSALKGLALGDADPALVREHRCTTRRSRRRATSATASSPGASRSSIAFIELAGNCVLYLALPPSVVEPTIEALGDADLARSRGFTRLVIEKPFGHDLASARR